MARHSDHRFETGKTLAARMIPFATALRGSKADHAALEEATRAVSFIGPRDNSELSRREIYASARSVASLARVELSPYAPALALFARALTLYSVNCEYVAAVQAADAAIAMAEGVKTPRKR